MKTLTERQIADIPGLCADLRQIVRDVRIHQTRFLVEHGFMSWEAARALPQDERDALQEKYAQWNKNQR